MKGEPMDLEPFQLARAPIVEAVIDFNCELGSQFEVASVESAAREAFSGEYPTEEKQWVQEIRVESHGEETTQTHTATLNALRFRSSEANQLVQVRRQGFSFNRLSPYTSLDDYMEQVEGLWNAFRSIVPVETVNQVSLRYINHIDPQIATASTWELSDYFTIGRSNAWNESVLINSFFMNYAGRSNRYDANFQALLAPNVSSGVVLDITVYKDLRIEPANWEALVEAIKVLRQFKNELFKEAITEKCLQLFQ